MDQKTIAATAGRTVPPGPGRRHDVRISPRREVVITVIALLVSLTAVVFLSMDMIAVGTRSWANGSASDLASLLVFVVLVAFLVYGGLVYQATRLGYLRRLRTAQQTGAAADGPPMLGTQPRVVVLVPSYREEPAVVRQTLLSAALQEYPDVMIVLLVDDPPDPEDASSIQLLDAARHMPANVEAMIDPIAAAVGEAARAFADRASGSAVFDVAKETERLAATYQSAALSIEGLSDSARGGVPAHVDALFEEQVLSASARRLRERANALMAGKSPVATSDQIASEYRWLASIFHVDVRSFERKRFLNLSHEPNKAMNVNAYIALLGGSWREEATVEGMTLVPDDEHGEPILDADYVVTLDADSIILPQYIATLVGILEQPSNDRLAVAQTPYSAIPGPGTRIERIAGATTDIQYIAHQGFTHYDATYWVGANAAIRKTALIDIEETVEERGHPVKRYIHDRTVIEDTESSVDLVAKGWSLYNHPHRLAYSATPPDFGSLVVQRQRWANGGLIILPKLLRERWARRQASLRWIVDSLVHGHYLVSIAATNVALLALLLIPFSAAYMSIWLPVTAAGYFFLYARDLSQNGYRHRDMVSVYALNLVLLPVNLAGVLKSIEQGIRHQKIPFARTPKVDGRTVAPARHLVALLVLLLLWAVGSFSDMSSGRWLLGLFAFANVLVLAYGITAFIGWRSMARDLVAQISPTSGVRRPLARVWQLPNRSTD